jgi:hypothetical protein
MRYYEELEKHIEKLQNELAKAEQIIDLQKKIIIQKHKKVRNVRIMVYFTALGEKHIATSYAKSWMTDDEFASSEPHGVEGVVDDMVKYLNHLKNIPNISRIDMIQLTRRSCHSIRQINLKADHNGMILNICGDNLKSNKMYQIPYRFKATKWIDMFLSEISEYFTPLHA